jgi:hypothetical protein
VFLPSDPDTIRVYSWEHIPDLLFLNPVSYFASHPEVESIRIENIDKSDRIKLVHDPADVDPTPLALVLRRSELSFNLCNYIRALQLWFFRRYDLLLPNHTEFTSTLHGK